MTTFRKWLVPSVLALLPGLLSADVDLPLREDALRTPDARFSDLPDYPFAPNYANVNDYRMHYVDEGDRDGEVVLMLHGQPTWSFLYRHMIPIVADAGHRVIAPDLLGFGRSDKPVDVDTHTYAFHVDAMHRFVEALDLQDVTLVVQDWGALIGLRVAAENPERIARIVIANGGLPTGHQEIGPAFMQWRQSVVAMRAAGDMPVGQIMQVAGTGAAAAAYDAPFPEARYKAGPLSLPLLVPISTDDPASQDNVRAWQELEQWEKPFLTAFGDSDPITRGGDLVFQQRVPGAAGQNHTTIAGGTHFLQETHGDVWAQIIIEFIRDNPLP